MFIKNKKGISELISFALLTLLVVTTSLSSYLFAKSSFESATLERDYDAMKQFLKGLNSKSTSLTYFDSSITSEFISFDSGQLIFENNTLSYQSLFSTTSSDICLDNFWYLNAGGYERIQIQFDKFNFSSDFSLLPGIYKLRFEYQKNISEMIVSFE